MKYRSPSPDVSLPTPPRSPRAEDINQSAVNLLDSLTAFYQQERYWVHHTRASLELALVKGIDAPPSLMNLDAPSLDDIERERSISSSSMNSVKSESPSPESAHASASRSLWMRRKQANGVRLKLEGLSAHRRRGRRPHRAPPTEPGARLLEMFSELVDARMESCQRISRLVRDSSSPAHFVC